MGLSLDTVLVSVSVEKKSLNILGPLISIYFIEVCSVKTTLCSLLKSTLLEHVVNISNRVYT